MNDNFYNTQRADLIDIDSDSDEEYYRALCTKCNGSGGLYSYVNGVETDVPCTNCGGEGRVKRPIPTSTDEQEDPITLIETALERSKQEEVPCLFITGLAGTGKSYSIKLMIANNPRFGLLCSTTGISAINLNAATINSVLKYYDTNSLQQKAIHNKIVPILKQLALVYDYLILDEVSMMEAEQLDIIYESLAALNAQVTVKRKLGLILTGDFCQLPPVQGRFAFEAECWSAFERNTVRLTKIWRQSDINYINALNYLREGKGADAAYVLEKDCGLQFYKDLDLEFEGTTIFAKNAEVDTFNNIRFRKLEGARYEMLRSVRGFPIKEWDKIPEQLSLKVGAYVMILANKYQEGIGLVKKMIYSNGDCGYVEAVEGDVVKVRLARTGECVWVDTVVRENTSKEEVKPGEWNYPTDGFEPFYDEEHKYYVIGEVEYCPLRLAYASTCHKVQGLSLDKVQISLHDRFFGSPSMAYVAFSRARSLEGLRVIATAPLLKLRCSINEKIRRFL